MLFRLERRHHDVDINSVTAVLETARHLLSTAGFALDCHGVRLPDRHGDVNHMELLAVGPSPLRWSVRVTANHEVNAWVEHQICLELRGIHVQQSVERDAFNEEMICASKQFRLMCVRSTSKLQR